jgi:hypothetical protein
LTEEQLDYIRAQAFMAEHRREGSIAECAWQLGEHPFVIGGGSVVMNGTPDGEFVKGDVAKIFRERQNKEWDGSPRFGIGPYEQMRPGVDWIARARLGKSDAERASEKQMLDALLK